MVPVKFPRGGTAVRAGACATAVPPGHTAAGGTRPGWIRSVDDIWRYESVRRQRWLVAGLAATVAVSLAACASSDRNSNSTTSNVATTAAATTADSGGAGGSETAAGSETGSAAPSSGANGAGGGETDQTFTFGAAGAPSVLDPLYATDGETFRVVRQMMEGLVGFKPGTADVEPLLAESWEASKDGLTWTFKIRQGVKFSDGTDLDAKAVCYNLDRMYSQTDAGATQAQYWSDTMGGFKDQKDDSGEPIPSLYDSCAADGENAVVKLK